ncbi:putative ABC transport system ATP-binding protein [Candidatus Xenohaliotis californiensis]|uniref:ABC transport system ATP-binding protein n=1 Tax=Candidatus Xenohaliotis californiensis TaxID=84677 RepID=A0ABP0EV95_9RICK|nr:putative ABC transport system ATP-binding protein [Candidatus Xenohaliotis californiensis]
MLSLKNISITLGKSTKLEHKVLNNLSLNVKTGEFVTIMGGNGAGKSTLFNVISGFLKPDSGSVTINGCNMTSLSQIKKSSLVSKVMQDSRAGTIENMSIFENMTFALKRGKKRGFKPFFNSSNKKFFQEKLQMLNMDLEYFIDKLVCNLSGGQRQAISLIMSTLADFKVLLLDEITSALDPKSSEIVMQLVAKILREKHCACIMITHNLDHAINYGNRLLFLKNGTFIAEYDYYAKQKLNHIELSSIY